jgi:hypothetical protein
VEAQPLRISARQLDCRLYAKKRRDAASTFSAPHGEGRAIGTGADAN